jgi:hypothetical protein
VRCRAHHCSTHTCYAVLLRTCVCRLSALLSALDIVFWRALSCTALRYPHLLCCFGLVYMCACRLSALLSALDIVFARALPCTPLRYPHVLCCFALNMVVQAVGAAVCPRHRVCERTAAVHRSSATLTCFAVRVYVSLQAVGAAVCPRHRACECAAVHTTALPLPAVLSCCEHVSAGCRRCCLP